MHQVTSPRNISWYWFIHNMHNYHTHKNTGYTKANHITMQVHTSWSSSAKHITITQSLPPPPNLKYCLKILGLKSMSLSLIHTQTRTHYTHFVVLKYSFGLTRYSWQPHLQTTLQAHLPEPPGDSATMKTSLVSITSFSIWTMVIRSLTYEKSTFILTRTSLISCILLSLCHEILSSIMKSCPLSWSPHLSCIINPAITSHPPRIALRVSLMSYPNHLNSVEGLTDELHPPHLNSVEDLTDELHPPHLNSIEDLTDELHPPHLNSVKDLTYELHPPQFHQGPYWWASSSSP